MTQLSIFCEADTDGGWCFHMHALVSPLKLTRSPFKGSQALASPDNNQQGGQRKTNCGPSQRHKTKQVHDGLQGLDGGNQDQRTNPTGNRGAKNGRRSPVLVGVGGSTADGQKWGGVGRSAGTLERQVPGEGASFFQGSGTGVLLAIQSSLTWGFLGRWW